MIMEEVIMLMEKVQENRKKNKKKEILHALTEADTISISVEVTVSPAMPVV